MLYNIIFGILFGIIIFLIIKKNDIIRGPNSQEIKYKIYKMNDKCYIFQPIVHVCK